MNNSELEFKKLGEIAEFRNGLNFGKGSHGKGCILLGVPDFKDRFTPEYSSLEEINPAGIAKEDDYLQRGDIVFVRSNGNKALVGRSLFIDKDVKALFSGFCIRARITCTCMDKLFCAYYTKTKAFKAQIQTASGTNISNLNQEILRNVNVPYFSKPDQEKISALLYTLDAKIDCNNRINSSLKSMAKTLFDYWFVQFEFPNGNQEPYRSSGGQMVYNSVLKREIPSGWSDRRLAQIANITMGQSPDGKSINETEDGIEFFQGSADFGLQFPTVRQYTTHPTRFAKRGDILLSVRAPVGDMNTANRDCCIGRGLAALNSKDKFDGFLFYVMHYFKQVFERRNGEGTTFGSITKDDLHSLPLAYPPTRLLERYDQIVSVYNRMIFARSEENLQLVQLREWLLPMLMNGQLTVV